MDGTSTRSEILLLGLLGSDGGTFPLFVPGDAGLPEPASEGTLSLFVGDLTAGEAAPLRKSIMFVSSSYVAIEGGPSGGCVEEIARGLGNYSKQNGLINQRKFEISDFHAWNPPGGGKFVAGG